MVKAYRPFWLTIHKYVGLVLGILITIIGVSGSIMIYQDEIEGALDPELHFVEPGPEIASPKEILDSAISTYPDRSPAQVVTNDGHPKRAYQIVMRKEGEPALRVFVNPYTLEVLGTHGGSTFLGLVSGLHVELLMGNKGKYVVGLVSLAMLITFVVGMILWWPSKSTLKRAFTVSWRFGLDRFLRDLHNVSGFYLLIVMFFLTFSGTAMTFPNATAAALKLIVPGEKLSLQRLPQSQPLPDGQSITIDEALGAARAVVPENDIQGVLSPFGPKHFYIVMTTPSDSIVQAPMRVVRIDQYSGDVLGTTSEANPSNVDRFVNGWIDPIHNGSVLGEVGRFLAFIGGLALPILFGSGTYMWYRRRQRI